METNETNEQLDLSGGDDPYPPPAAAAIRVTQREKELTAVGRNRREEKMILALLEHSSIEKAAASVGISQVTFYRHTRRPEFQEAMRQARIEAFSRAIARLQQASSAAVTTLLRIMCDPNTADATRVRAAVAVLDLATRATEVENLAVRVERLEELAQEAGLSRSQVIDVAGVHTSPPTVAIERD